LEIYRPGAGCPSSHPTLQQCQSAEKSETTEKHSTNVCYKLTRLRYTSPAIIMHATHTEAGDRVCTLRKKRH